MGDHMHLQAGMPGNNHAAELDSMKQKLGALEAKQNAFALDSIKQKLGDIDKHLSLGRASTRSPTPKSCS
jgi:hypothetical protein